MDGADFGGGPLSHGLASSVADRALAAPTLVGAGVNARAEFDAWLLHRGEALHIHQGSAAARFWCVSWLS